MADYIVHKAIETKNLRKGSKLAQRIAADGNADVVVRQFLKQLKHDGCNCVVIWDPLGAYYTDKLQVFSRTGEVVKSMDHIQVDLEQMPPGVYLGEAWAAGIPFPRISGIFRRKRVKAGDALLHLQVFDGLTLAEWKEGHSAMPFMRRWQNVQTRLGYCAYPRYIHPSAPTGGAVIDTQWDTMAQAVAQAVTLQDKGFDGLIYRDPMGTWTAGDDGGNGEIIKVKPRERYTLRVVGFEPGKGKHAGKVGTLVVAFRGQRQGAGTGLKDRQRSVERFVADWLGRLVEVECLGVTADGFLREPVMLGLRTDAVEDVA